MDIRKGDIVLDVGCGTGRLAFQVSGITGASGKVVGIDPSQHRIQVANEKLKKFSPGNVRFAVGRGESLHLFGDNVFDILYYCAVFHWIDDRQAALGEAFRVLKPGGKIGITSRDGDRTSLRRAAIREMLERYPDEMRELKSDAFSQWVGRAELETLLTNAGFKNIRFESRTRILYFSSPEDYFAFLKSSSFGQSSGLPDQIRQEIALKIADALEKRRTPRGIEMQTSSLFAIAEKPKDKR